MSKIKGTSMAMFADLISDYESDTFSASGSEITPAEAIEVAQRILAVWIDDRLDGVIIDGTLAEVRESHDSAN